MDKRIVQKAALTLGVGATLLGVTVASAAPKSAAVVCNPGVNVNEASYGSWVASAAGHVVCDTSYVTVSPGGAGKVSGSGNVDVRICGSNNFGNSGGCYSAYASNTSGTYTFNAPGSIPMAAGWTHNYLAVMLKSSGARVSSFH